MALVSSHVLNGTDGTHAGGISVSLRNVSTGAVLFSAQMDAGGRLKQEIQPDLIDPQAMCELVFDTAPYWKDRGHQTAIPEVILRFKMNDPDGLYHMPIILNPNSYSMWCSS